MRLSQALVNQQAALVSTLLSGGFLRLYAGTRPATVETAPSIAEPLLAELVFGVTAFSTPVDGVMTANLFDDTSAIGGGSATWARAYMADGTTPVFDVFCGLPGFGAELVLSTLFIGSGKVVHATSLTYSVPS